MHSYYFFYAFCKSARDIVIILYSMWFFFQLFALCTSITWTSPTAPLFPNSCATFSSPSLPSFPTSNSSESPSHSYSAPFLPCTSCVSAPPTCICSKPGECLAEDGNIITVFFEIDTEDECVRLCRWVTIYLLSKVRRDTHRETGSNCNLFQGGVALQALHLPWACSWSQ